MEYKDYYSVLGVPKDADQAAVKKAYRRLARKLDRVMELRQGKLHALAASEV